MTNYQILITTYYNNQTHAIAIGEGDLTVHDLKKMLARKDGVPEKLMTQQYTRLINGQTELFDNQLINKTAIENDANLKVYPRLNGFQNRARL